jgi:hypothetical protein
MFSASELPSGYISGILAALGDFWSLSLPSYLTGHLACVAGEIQRCSVTTISFVMFAVCCLFSSFSQLILVFDLWYIPSVLYLFVVTYYSCQISFPNSSCQWSTRMWINLNHKPMVAQVWDACKWNDDVTGRPNHELDTLRGHEHDVNYVQFRCVFGSAPHSSLPLTVYSQN